MNTSGSFGISVSKIALLLAATAIVPSTSQEAFAQDRDTENETVFEEIIVTAQRRAERLSDVPVSVKAVTQADADRRSLVDIGDVARITPNLNLTSTGNTINRISIRGVDSDAGAGTTGIYINDVPIQVRQIGFNAFDVFPLIFDLERVEVLRGPQGTLFGAGSQGGTVRFITPEASTTDYSGYGRFEASTTENGGEGFEAGFAFGGPIIKDKLGFRANIWTRETAGFIDRVNGSTATPGNFDVVDTNVNSAEALVLRAELKWQVTEDFSITPSVFHQEQDFNDSSVFWLEDVGPGDNPEPRTASFLDSYTSPLVFSDPSSGQFRSGEPTQQRGEDDFTLFSLKMQYETDWARFVAIGSYFDRKQTLPDDFTTFDQVLFTGVVNGAIAGVTPLGISRPVLPGQQAISFDTNEQENYTVEFRVESGEETIEGLDWVVGLFYQETEQSAVQQVEDLFLGPVLDQQFLDLFGTDVSGLFTGVPGGDPIETFFGIPLVDDRFIFDNLEIAKDRQFAGFAQFDYEFIENVTFTAGIRISDTRFSIFNEVVGPVLGPFSTGNVSQSETPITPKFSLSWKPSADLLLYASASQGFRIGGANAAVGLPCGVTDGEPIPGTALGILGLSDRPTSFESDDLWSYELGAKGTFFNGKLQAEASVFRIDWSNIQQNLQLPACGFRYFDNVGSATIEGFEVAASFAPIDALLFQLAIGHNDATFDETVFATPGAQSVGALPILSEGDSLGAAPFTVNAAVQFNFDGPLDMGYYLRFDWDHTQAADDLAVQNPANGVFDPFFIQNPDTDFVNVRLAAQVTEEFEVSLFATNLTNEAPVLNNLVQPGGTLQRAQTFRPRTIGLRGIVRF